jgi:hypothetical protein
VEKEVHHICLQIFAMNLLMGKKVLTTIISKIKAARYYSLSVDSTPDLSRVEQLTFIVWFVKAYCEIFAIFSYRRA